MEDKKPFSTAPLIQYVSRVSNTFLADLRTSLLWVMPCVVLLSLIALIVSIGQLVFADQTAMVNALNELYRVTHTLFGYLLITALTFAIAMRLKEPRPVHVMLSLFFFGSFHFIAQSSESGHALQYLVAFFTPIYTVPLLAWLRTKRLFNIKQIRHSNNHIIESINFIFPACVVMILVFAVNLALVNSWPLFSPPEITLEAIQDSPYWFGSLFTMISSISHFLGIHSIYTLPFLHDPMFAALNQNIEAHQQGLQAVNALNWTSAPVFGLLGGSGATLGLVIAILMTCKEKSLRTIAIIGIPLSLLNINEILIFGIPIILNPSLFIPFLLAPTVCVCLAIYCINLGLIAPSVVSVPFVSPIFANAYLATDGDINAVLLQLVCLAISTLIYVPFVKHVEKSLLGDTIYFPIFDSYYARKQEEALLVSDDLIARINKQNQENKELEKSLSFISEIEFFLEYQPQVSVSDNRIVSAEALIRASDRFRNYLPYYFLPWLEKADMMKDLDLWVVNQAIEDIQKLKSVGIHIRISINLSASSLLDEAIVEAIIKKLKSSGVADYFDIEVTEQSLLKDQHTISHSFQKFKELGVHIHIDDFGTGYSSLSYLSKFDIDVLKIDRSFVLATETEKGERLFKSLFDIAESQQLNVIVEGVEKQQERELVPKLNTVLIQGWYYSKSLNLTDFMHYYHEFNEDKQSA